MWGTGIVPDGLSMSEDRHNDSRARKIDTTYLSLTGQDLWGDLNNDLDTLSLAERSTIVELDRHLHAQWDLGRNFILGWYPHGKGIDLLIVPHYTVAEYALATRDNHADTITGHEAADFVMGMLGRKRQLDERKMRNASKLLNTDPVNIILRQPLTGSAAETRIIEKLVRSQN